MTKTTGSAFSTAVGGRIFEGKAPERAVLPYCVFFIVHARPDKTFTEDYSDIIIQFSMFSDSEGVTEITGIYEALQSLFDECTLTITSATLIRMHETNLITGVEDITTQSAADRVRHWSADYEILIET